jgi:hypothetical protein
MTKITESELRELFSSCSWAERLSLAIFLIDWCIRDKQGTARLEIKDNSGKYLHLIKFPYPGSFNTSGNKGDNN